MASKVNRLSGLIRPHDWRLSPGPARVDTLHLADQNTERHIAPGHRAGPWPARHNCDDYSVLELVTISCPRSVVVAVATSLGLNSASCSRSCTRLCSFKGSSGSTAHSREVHQTGRVSSEGIKRDGRRRGKQNETYLPL